jgi:hypothetical protein
MQCVLNIFIKIYLYKYIMKLNNGFYSGIILSFTYLFYQDQKAYNRLKIQYGQIANRRRDNEINR